MLPWPVCPLAGHARLGQNVVAGSMRILLSWLCWGACQEGVCLDPHFHCNCTSPRFSGELPPKAYRLTNKPMTMSCICVDFEKQIVLRTKRLMRVRNVRCLRSICCVLCLPGLCSSGSRWRVYVPQESV